MSKRTDARSVAWRQTSLEWWRQQGPRHELFVSGGVLAELSDPQFQRGPAALAMLAGLGVLDLTAEVHGLAEILVRERVMPRPAIAGDALHVAAATVHGMEYVLT